MKYTTTHLKLAAKKLDNPPVIMGIVVAIFLLAALVAAAGRYTPARSADLRPIILVLTARPAEPVYIDRVVERIIVATPTPAPEPAPAAPEPIVVLNAPPTATGEDERDTPAPDWYTDIATPEPAFVNALIGSDPNAPACTGANGIVSPLCGGISNADARRTPAAR